MIKEAVLSEDGKYRYSLTRIWDESKPIVMWVMLNPSKANADFDDPTIRKCVGFASSWGYGGIAVFNLFSYVSPFLEDLLTVEYLIKDFQKYYSEFDRLHDMSEIMVLAWGNDNLIRRLAKTRNMILKPRQGGRVANHTEMMLNLPKYKKARYLALSKYGVPKHPLYLPYSLTPLKFEPQK